MKILVTGSNGFVAKNLMVRLNELEGFETVTFSRQMPETQLAGLISDIDAVVHLAGVNRPPSPEEFVSGNTGLTQSLCLALLDCGRQVPVIFTSSTQAALNNPYGKSKLDAEQTLRRYAAQTGAPVYIYRLPNVFGKWCKPNYNSAVATFCHNIATGLPIQINDSNAALSLVYVDDVVDEFIRALTNKLHLEATEFCSVPIQYQTTVGELAQQLEAFRDSRTSLISEKVGAGLVRALYSTYMSYLSPEAFAYEVPKFGDPRGVFVEMLKTKDSGQFSFFTAHPGITRGGHYHHSKTEKFLVIKGQARFGFRHILTDETYELVTSGEQPTIVETIPGWSHDITNVGEEEMVVMLWANEIFDRDRPDTIASKV
ncbi:UDP-2-acetamido-2,6-beta-L-arabino-hexul-4-ose reductase [Methylobacter svalbardensis]|uniref:UDP-2-acetamido-2,6-beta-L-arabino-hexul-4-ose reductase n=1 Tax=Methylobacter svalbardensis TaxID=3080016 RepID=UPI0030EE7023